MEPKPQYGCCHSPARSTTGRTRRAPIHVGLVRGPWPLDYSVYGLAQGRMQLSNKGKRPICEQRSEQPSDKPFILKGRHETVASLNSQEEPKAGLDPLQRNMRLRLNAIKTKRVSCYPYSVAYDTQEGYETLWDLGNSGKTPDGFTRSRKTSVRVKVDQTLEEPHKKRTCEWAGFEQVMWRFHLSTMAKWRDICHPKADEAVCRWKDAMGAHPTSVPCRSKIS